jgi:ABC-type multidrug transport system fused ATPase/permease subunit
VDRQSGAAALMFAALGNPALGQILSRMNRSRRRQLYLLMALMLIGAAAELTAIATVVPFLSLLADTNGTPGFEGTRLILERLGADSPQEQLLVATTAFALAALGAGALRIGLTWMTASFSFGLGHDLALAIQTRLLHQPYAFHTSSNSSDFVAAQEKVFAFIHDTILPTLNALTATVASIFIIAILAYIDPVATGVAVLVVSALYLAVSCFTQERLHRYGSIINLTHTERVRSVQESLGGIRDVILDHSQPAHLAHFAGISRRLARFEMKAAFVTSTPRHAIEAVGMILIALLAVVLSKNGGFAAALPILGAMALSAQRLLPLLQQVFHGWAQLRTSTASATELASLLNLEMPSTTLSADYEPLPFEHEIRLTNVSFRYPGRHGAGLHNISLSIRRGSWIALVGRTGSGKSTLLDILMGLLDPTEGSLTVDGVSPTGGNRIGWQSQIAHVPQAIFLADTTIARNIAFGQAENEMDLERVRWASALARADEFINTLPDKYQTLVGERGIRLSGGERQRLGIARALYKRAPLLILDEATSALDPETEEAIVRSLAELGDAVTVVMVAHRLPSIAHCGTVVRLERGGIVQIGTCAQLPGPEDRKEIKRNIS